MNILYCGDSGIKDGLTVSILSLLKNSTSPLHIYVMTIDYENSAPIQDKTISLLDEIVKCHKKISITPPKTLNFNPETENFVKKLDATEIFKNTPPEKNLNTIFTKKYFKPCAMLRLYLDQIPELKKLEKLLYLGYDVVCRKDPTEFYETDLKNFEAAGTLDIYGKNFYHYNLPKPNLKNPKEVLKALKNYEPDYMNSGVLLFNLEACTKSALFPRAVEICREKRLMLADQAALNKVIRRRKLLPLAFNDQNERPAEDSVFHHFSNNFKFKPYFHVQKIKSFEVDKIHDILKITEYDDILAAYQTLKPELTKGLN